MMAGGYVTVRTGQAPDAHAVAIPKEKADKAMDAAACIGCGACVASCKNASAMLFTSAKVSQLAHLPQGQPERKERALRMVMAHDALGFGNCTNESECQSACPKEISVKNISLLNRDFARGGVSLEEVTG
jgi:succinate dehydrogenase / fumarate reductase iron-sulfur subunit